MTVNLCDSYGAIAPGQNLNLTITNVVPINFISVARVVPKGQLYTDLLSFADPGANTRTSLVNYGDGTAAVPATVHSGAKTVAFNHTSPSNGIYTIAVLVCDDDLGETCLLYTSPSPRD